jgi:hypothetical protein
VAGHHRELLWRTRMTVGARAVSQREALPQLIAAASPYFGRDMDEAEVLTTRVSKSGRVEVGEPKVIELPAGESPSRSKK